MGTIRMLSRRYLLMRISGEVMHKFAKKRNLRENRRDERRERRRTAAGRVKKKKVPTKKGRRARRDLARARYSAHCIIPNKFQWMPKHFHPIFFRRATHTPEYLRRSYTPADPSSHDSRKRRLWPRVEDTLRFPSSTKRRDIFRNIWPVHPVDLTRPVNLLHILI